MSPHTRLYLVHSQATLSQLFAVLAALNLARAWEVILKPHRRTRTAKQNARYWSVLNFAADHSGYHAQELHELCKHHILGSDICALGAVDIEIPRSTRRLNTTEFSEYAARAESWLATELDLRLPAWGFD